MGSGYTKSQAWSVLVDGATLPDPVARIFQMEIHEIEIKDQDRPRFELSVVFFHELCSKSSKRG